MSTSIQRRRGTTAQHSSFTGANGEITIDTDKEVVVVHDGATAGGYPAMRENGSNSALALGSAATPSLKFTGDTNTGLYSPGADQVAISTNGTGRLFVDSSGAVGIGLASDNSAYRLNVYNPSADFCAVSIGNNVSGGGASNGLVIAQNQADALFINRENGYAAFSTNNTERMRLDSSGRLGLGTSSPAAILHTLVSQAGSTAAEIFRAQATNTTDNVITRLDVAAEPALGTASLVRLSAITGNAADSANMAFNVRNGSVSTEVLRLSSTGRVGIGTTGPTTILHAAGTGDQAVLVESTSATVASAEFIAKHANGPTQVRMRARDGLCDMTSTTNYPLAFGTNNTERARIDTSGRLLVGTSTSLAIASAANGQFQVANAQAPGIASLSTFANDAGGAYLMIGKSRGTSIGSYTVVQNNDELGVIRFAGADGTDLQTIGAAIAAEVDGTPGANDLPSRLVFSTTADGASSPTERMRITSDAYVRLASGTGGIQFNGDTAAANALDDYEEGTWTPIVFDTTNADISSLFTSAGNAARYTKIGRLVTITCPLYSGDATVSQLIKRIDGLPFTLANFNFSGTAVQFSIFGKNNGDRTVSSSASAYMIHSEASIRINNSISIAQFGTAALFTAVFFTG